VSNLEKLWFIYPFGQVKWMIDSSAVRNLLLDYSVPGKCGLKDQMRK